LKRFKPYLSIEIIKGGEINMDNIVTSDFSKYGYKEIDEASDLLKAYAENGCDFLSDNVQVNFNMNSGYVFLTDDDMNVAMLNDDGKLVQFYSCPNCGNEGTQADGLENKWNFEKYEGYCSRKCLKS
jgi:hypothetical protein